MKFGQIFIKLINSLYSRQSAKIIINGEQTDKFTIEKGVRQGCPLSPLLFILTLETLLIKIRENEEIKGLKIRKEHFKVQAFADDVVFIVEDPMITIPKLVKQIEIFGEAAGLKINRKKTKIVTKNCSENQVEELAQVTDMQIVKKIKYLGIWITAKCSTIKEDNYTKLLDQIKKDLQNWKGLQLSLMGRVNVVKMNILPRLLFLFQTVPINPGKNFFMELNKVINKYIWLGKKSRIKLKSMQDVKERGGLGLPNWKLYYRAAALIWIRDWILLENKRLLILEGHDLLLGWHAYLWYEKHKIHTYFKKHILRNSLMQIWQEIKKHHYLKTPEWVSPIESKYHPNLIHSENTIKYNELLKGNFNLKTREELEEEGKLLDWWTYIQIRDTFQQDKKGQGFQVGKGPLDKILLGVEENLIGKTYKYLLRYETEEEIVKDNMISWGKNIGHAIELDKWEKIWAFNWKITKSNAFKENQCKMFYRWHLPPQRLSKMFPNISPLCWKCKKENGSFYHLWWTCPKARKFWDIIIKWLKEITKEEFDKKPELFLLGICNKRYKKETQYLLIHILTAARIAYAQLWKNENTPKEGLIIKKIMDCAEMDRLTKKLEGKEDTEYYKIWDNFYDWFKERNNSGSEFG